MESAALVLVALACPLGMGLCMWLMARGMRGGSAQEKANPAEQPSLAELRSEQDRLAAEIARAEREAGNGIEAAPSREAPAPPA